MRCLKLVTFAQVFLLLASSAAASRRSGSWDAVKRLHAGDYISVKTAFPFRTLCLFVRATGDELICSPIKRGPTRTIPDRLRFRRAKVREVRMERSDNANRAALGAIVGGAAATAAAINNPASRGFSAVIAGVMGSGIGGTIGGILHVLHGRIVYKR